MGAVYNIVTKQGTNQFHGDASGFFQSEGLTSNNTENVKFPNGKFADACADDPDARCPWTRGEYYEVTAQLGGPIVRDKLWFFGSYGHQKDEFTRVGVNSELPGSAIDTTKDRVLAQGHLADDAEPAARRQLPSRRGRRATPATASTRPRRQRGPGRRRRRRRAWPTRRRCRTRRCWTFATPGSTATSPGIRPIPSSRSTSPASSTATTGKISGGNYYWYTYDACRTTATAKVSRHAAQFLGAEQDFHFGVQYNQAGVSGVYGYNDFIYTYLVDGELYGYGNVRQPFSYAAQIRNFGAFVDSNVRLGDRVTLNLGVRVDYSNALAPEQEELDDNAQPTGRTFPRADFFTWDSISPRLGLNMKLNSAGKTVIKSHWGRYHPQITTGEFANIIGPNIKPYYQGTYNFATGEVEDLFLTSSSENLSVSPGYNNPRTDQFILGVEQELNSKMGLQVNYVRKVGARFRRLARHRRHLRAGDGRRRLRTGSHRATDRDSPA